MSTTPAPPVKLEMTEYDHSNSSYGEPPAKRVNSTQPPPSNSQRSQGSGGNAADANVTLWQFLLDLLVKQQYSSIICWTNNEGEFKLLDAEQVAKLWGLKKNKNNMNYDKLSRALRYYYDKNIIKKVMGQKFVYRFVSFPEMVKTENRIPFKKKMESIVNESNPIATTANPVSSAMSGFQTLRPYDVKSGLIQQAQLAAAATLAQQQNFMMHQQAVAQAMVEQKYQIPAEHHALYHNGGEASQSQPKLPSGADIHHNTSSMGSRSPTPNMPSNTLQSNLSSCMTAGPAMPQRVPTPARPTTPMTPVSVCTPTASPSPAPVFDLPVSGTPTPPPKPFTPPASTTTSEVKVKLEIPELDDNRNCQKSESGAEINGRRMSKQSKLKPDPLSISNDVVNTSVTSPLMSRGLLPSLNTPMFLPSPMFGQRTPLIPGIHFWGPGTLSPVHTLSPRLGLPTGPAFQFPAFAAISPATLASFSSFSDNVFSNATTPNANSDRDKKVSS